MEEAAVHRGQKISLRKRRNGELLVSNAKVRRNRNFSPFLCSDITCELAK